jgi:predicted dienelactone hydrolase
MLAGKVDLVQFEIKPLMHEWTVCDASIMQVQVGCREITTFDPLQQARISAWILYPTHDTAATMRFGPYSLELAMDAIPMTNNLPVVMISHGNGGTPWSHRGLAIHLVRSGFAVGMIEHPGNHRSDNSLGSPSGRVKSVLLQHRPRHIRLTFDASLADPHIGPQLKRDDFAVIGESIGAYTALAVAGGRTMTVPDDVEDARLLAPDDELAKLAFSVPTERDRRIRAAVLLVPAISFFMADEALADVEIPLLVRTAECDPFCPAKQVARSLRSLPNPARVSILNVPGAGHFSFQTPYPPELASIPPAQDPPGFNRVSYQPILFADVTNFLNSTPSQ